jgi:hypothetical protein
MDNARQANRKIADEEKRKTLSGGLQAIISNRVLLAVYVTKRL